MAEGWRRLSRFCRWWWRCSALSSRLASCCRWCPTRAGAQGGHGIGGAAHGGVLALIFDEILGRLANPGRTRSRTAYLHVNYRNITPIGPELRVEAHVDRVAGRKRYLTGAIYRDGTLTAAAEGLFVELKPGQP